MMNPPPVTNSELIMPQDGSTLGYNQNETYISQSHHPGTGESYTHSGYEFGQFIYPSNPDYYYGGEVYRRKPVFNLLRQGSGISYAEQQGIIGNAMTIYELGITPISNETARHIKRSLGGDWIVIVYPEGKPVDFNMTCVEGNDYMYFTLDAIAYQVCRLR